MTSPPLTDAFGRVHRSLRVSVTDRCNLRCRYCMPAEGMPWLSRDVVLTDDEFVRLTALFARLGITDLRVTGGEPLVRAGLPALLARMRVLPGVREMAITTNGVLLADRIDDLVAAGVDRVNVSIDSLDPERFATITRRDDLQRVLEGLAACEGYERFRPIKVNAVVLRGVSEDDVLPLAELARRRPYVVRFIEAMPLDAEREWAREHVMPGEEVRALVEARWPLVPAGRERPAAPGTTWRFADGAGTLQFVNSVTQPFCQSCDRLRLTADGMLRTCLFADVETDLRTPLRADAGDADLEAIIRAAVLEKKAGHGIGTPGWRYDGRPMSMIGG
ncbi:MAG: GTP 3',8-cyclase MoaA [Thermoleophilia bacterium]